MPTLLELYFQKFRKNIIGIDQEFSSPYGSKKNHLYRLDGEWSFVSSHRRKNDE